MPLVNEPPQIPEGLRPVLGVRELTLSLPEGGSRPIFAVIGAPVPVDEEDPAGPDEFKCRVAVLGLGATSIDEAIGMDQLDAIRSAFILLGSILSSSAPAREGRLAWGGGSAPYGFLTPDLSHSETPDGAFPYLG